jgi:hypothetical protein
MATSLDATGSTPATAEKFSKRAGRVEATKLGARVFSRLPWASNSEATENTSPAATATPGTARTFASVAALIVAVCTCAPEPSA